MSAAMDGLRTWAQRSDFAADLVGGGPWLYTTGRGTTVAIATDGHVLLGVREPASVDGLRAVPRTLDPRKLAGIVDGAPRPRCTVDGERFRAWLGDPQWATAEQAPPRMRSGTVFAQLVNLRRLAQVLDAMPHAETYRIGVAAGAAVGEPDPHPMVYVYSEGWFALVAGLPAERYAGEGPAPAWIETLTTEVV